MLNFNFILCYLQYYYVQILSLFTIIVIVIEILCIIMLTYHCSTVNIEVISIVSIKYFKPQFIFGVTYYNTTTIFCCGAIIILHCHHHHHRDLVQDDLAQDADLPLPLLGIMIHNHDHLSSFFAIVVFQKNAKMLVLHNMLGLLLQWAVFFCNFLSTAATSSKSCRHIYWDNDFYAFCTRMIVSTFVIVNIIVFAFITLKTLDVVNENAFDALF